MLGNVSSRFRIAKNGRLIRVSFVDSASILYFFLYFNWSILIFIVELWTETDSVMEQENLRIGSRRKIRCLGCICDHQFVLHCYMGQSHSL